MQALATTTLGTVCSETIHFSRYRATGQCSLEREAFHYQEYAASQYRGSKGAQRRTKARSKLILMPCEWFM